jgi:two-component system response regulator MprA
MADCAVLVVDDDRTFCDVMLEALTLDGYPTRVAYNGAEALRELAAYAPRFMLLDLRMPFLDGASLVREVQAHGSAVQICLTSGGDDCWAMAVELGVQWCLPKPFELDELLGIVAKACS